MIANFLVMLVFGGFGLTCHWLKRWAKRQTTKDFLIYMRTNRKSSIGSVIGMVAAVFALAPGADVPLTIATLASAWLAGYSADSILKNE